MAESTIDLVWRDYVTDGVPSSGKHNPVKADIRDTLNARFGSSPEPIVILATGQSNVVNGGTWTEDLPANLYVWNSSTIGTTGTAFASPSSLVASHIKWSWSFAAQIAREFPARKVYVLNIGSAGRTIYHWLPDSPSPDPDVYADIQTKVAAALAVLGVDHIDILMWWQGESDALDVANDGIALYETNFEAVMARFESETWFRYGTPKVIASVASSAHNGTGTYYLQINGVLQDVVANDPSARVYSYNGDIPTAYWDDASHLLGTGYELAGRLAYNAFRNNYAQPAGLVYERERDTFGFGAEVPYAKVTISRNAEPNVTPGTAVELDWLAHLIGKDTEEAKAQISGYGSNASLTLQRANGTGKTPSGVTNGQLVGALKTRAYGATAFGSGPELRVIATEAWSDSARGARWEVYTISNTTTTLTRRIQVYNGLLMEGATGGDKGVGTINAIGVYDDNTLLTDLVLDMAVTGSFDEQKYAGHPIAGEMQPWWFDPSAYAAFWRENRRLPGMPSWDRPEDRPSTGEMITRLLAQAELQAVMIDKLAKRVEVLEAR